MNKQKWLAGLTAVLCSAGALSCFPAISGTVSAAELVSNDFEVNYGGWYGSAAVSYTHLSYHQYLAQIHHNNI